MENASLPTNVVALKVVYIIIGAIGILDNLFVIIVFILYIKITEKVLHNTPTIITVDLYDFQQLIIHIPAAFRV